MPRQKPMLAILGPTAIGKTAVGIEVALRMEGEIISADSRQIYRTLDIGTAKPTRAERARVKHHFIDELDPDEPYSAGAFCTDARLRQDQISTRGKTSLVVGGSTLYVHALIDGLADIPAIPDDVKRKVRAKFDSVGPDGLHALLTECDPVGAASLDATKTRRVQRMLEVFYTTGKPISSYWDQNAIAPMAVRKIVLDMDRKVLYDRINRRTTAMFESGLVDEVAGLLSAGYDEELPPLRTIGYQECFPYLRGEISLQEAISNVARNTRRYAKRQLTWLRRYSDAQWFQVKPEDDPEHIAEHILREAVG